MTDDPVHRSRFQFGLADLLLFVLLIGSIATAIVAKPWTILSTFEKENLSGFGDFSHDGRRLALIESDAVKIIDLVNDQEAQRIASQANNASGECFFSRDDLRIATRFPSHANRRVDRLTVYSVSTGEQLGTAELPKMSLRHFRLAKFMSPNCDLFVKPGGELDSEGVPVDVDLSLTTVSGSKVVVQTRGYDFAFSSDGTKWVTASDDHILRIWNTATGEKCAQVAMGDDEYVSNLKPFPNRDAVLVLGIPRARILDLTKNSLSTLCESERGLDMEDADVSPDGTKLVAHGYADYVNIYDIPSSRLIANLGGGSTDGVEVHFLPDSQWFYVSTISGGESKDVYFAKANMFFDANTGQSYSRLKDMYDFGPSLLSPNGDYLLTESNHGLALWQRRWPMSSLRPWMNPAYWLVALVVSLWIGRIVYKLLVLTRGKAERRARDARVP